jgi:hypothetical protein
MIMRGIIDRFEGDYVIVEMDDKLLSVKREAFPAQAQEGDVVVLMGEVWLVDDEATHKLRREIEELAKELWEDEKQP